MHQKFLQRAPEVVPRNPQPGAEGASSAGCRRCRVAREDRLHPGVQLVPHPEPLVRAENVRVRERQHRLEAEPLGHLDRA